jgi:hypothetical protein
MAGPSVAVRVLGDLTGFSKSMTDTAAHGETVGKRLGAAFKGALSAINQTGVLGPFGEALDGIDEAIGRVKEHGKQIGPAMMGVGTSLAGIGLGLSALGSKDQAAHQQLQAAVEATGKDYETYAGQVEKAIGKQEKYGTTANQTQDALRIMTQAMGDPQKALNYLGEASDLAAAKHESLSTAATQLSKAYGGNAKVLKEFGIDLHHMTDEHGNAITGAEANARAMQLLGDKISGQADSAANTFGGHLEGLKAHLEDMASNLGQKYGPALTAIGSVMTGVGAAVSVASALLDTQAAAWLADQIAAMAAAVAENVALLGIPILIAAVVAGIAWMVTHWEQTKDAVMDVYNWIVDHWPLLLDIILGPIGIAAGQVIQHWHGIKDAAVGVWQWIVGAWGAVTEAIVSPIRAAWQQLGAIWQGIKDGASGVYDWVVQKFDDLVGAIQGVISGISRVVGDVVNAIKAPINAVIGLWNGLSFHVPEFTLPSFSGLTVLGQTVIPGWQGPTLGGQTFGFPHIPTLAQGGLITGEGLVYAHAAEVIAPIDKVGIGGPAVNIETAYFAQEVDVDLLLKRAAWAMQLRSA